MLCSHVRGQTVFCLKGRFQCCVVGFGVACQCVLQGLSLPRSLNCSALSPIPLSSLVRPPPPSSSALLLRPPPRLAFAQVAELTQIPLTLVDACRAFKPLRTMIPTVNSVSRIAFALSFLALRLIAWPIVR